MSRASVPMFRGNAARTGEMPGPGPAGTPRVLWRFETSGDSICAAVVANGVVYVAGNTRVSAYDECTGSERWRF